MPQVSKRLVQKKTQEKIQKLFLFALTKCTSASLTQELVEDLLTPTEQVMLSKKEIKAVLEGIKTIVKAHLAKNGPGQVVIPGLLKITSVTKPASKARKGRNPFTGEEMMIKAKPARKVIKVKALKKFKTELE